jgi:hypothetical protein
VKPILVFPEPLALEIPKLVFIAMKEIARTNQSPTK